MNKSSDFSKVSNSIQKLLFIGIFLVSKVALAQVTATKNVEQLYKDLDKINKSIETSREKLKTVKDARFLPDLYFALAELYVDKSRYMYAVKRLENKDTPAGELDFTAEKKPKLQAIEIYQNILDKFPNSKDRDKALFFMGHEYRELGATEDMLKTYGKLTTEYPDSSFWEESELIIGNYFFEEKKDFEFALTTYKKILDRKPGPFTPLARYKMGWVYINLSKFKESLLAFEQVLKQDKDIDISSLPDLYKKTDVRRDALVAMVWPYSELKPEEMRAIGGDISDPLRYFFNLSNNKISYQRVLKNLGRRLTVKVKTVVATRVYFEMLRITDDLETKIEVIDKVYESMRNSKQRWPVNFFVDEIAKTVFRLRTTEKIPAKEREKNIVNFEIYARDAATRFHERAQQTHSNDEYKLATHAYRQYMAAFPDSKYIGAMKLNLAESLYNLKEYPLAGKQYEELARLTKIPQKRKTYLDSALQSYITSLKTPDMLTRLELMESRNGLREVGIIFSKDYPKDNALPNLRFLIGRTYYDERNFDKAVSALQGYIKAHPTDSNVRLAADLILDSFHQREDYKGLAKAGKLLVADSRISKQTRDEISEIVKQAEYKEIQEKTGAKGGKEGVQELLKFAAKYKGSTIGDQALYEAFVTLKSKKDPKAYEPGEQLLIQHENSKYAKEVVTAMGQMALTTADFRRASKYFEAYAKKYPKDTESRNLLKNSATMREYMGDFKQAKEDYLSIGDTTGSARMDFLASDWNALTQSAAQLGGLQGSYWAGLAFYRLKNPQRATGFLRQAASQGGGNFEEKTMAAHALYLLSSEALKQYKSIQIELGKEQQAIKAKSSGLDNLTQQLNRVIAFGNGRWTIAAMYGMGQANFEFAEFLRRAPVPGVLQGAQVQQYKAAIEKEASKYSDTAKKLFGQCLQNAEKFEVFTQFVKGCMSGGKLEVDEEKESKIIVKAGESSPAEAAVVRSKLYDNSRDVNLLMDLASVYAKNRDYAMAQLVLSRGLEIDPNSATMTALRGTNYLFMNDLDSAQAYFQKALKMKANEPNALWGMAGLYNEFKYKKLYSATKSKAQRAGQPRPPIHEFVSHAQ